MDPQHIQQLMDEGHPRPSAERIAQLEADLQPSAERIAQLEADLQRETTRVEVAERHARSLRYVWLLRNRCSVQYLRIAHNMMHH